MTDLERCFLDKFIEKPDALEVTVIADEFEIYLESLNLSDEEKRSLSNLRTDYGAACKKMGFLRGYAAGLDLIKQMAVLFLKDEEDVSGKI